MKHLASALAVILVVACSEPAPPPAPSAKPKPKPKPAPTVSINAPAGTYAIDPNHYSLEFKIGHAGLAPYVARFTGTEATLQLDPARVSNSKISVTVDPMSVKTDFAGDYKATHEGTPYSSFEEFIGKDEKAFHSGAHPEITFKSTNVKVSGNNQLKVTGDLSFLGQTRPLTLDVTVFGSMAQHPWTKKGAIGFTAIGSFARSKFGMQGLQGPLADSVTIEFNGEFHQQESAEPEAGGDDTAADEATADDAGSNADAEPSEEDYEY